MTDVAKLAEQARAGIEWLRTVAKQDWVWPVEDDATKALAAVDALKALVEEQAAEIERLREQKWGEVYEAVGRAGRAEAERDALRAALVRAATLAQHLLEMIDRQAWRDSGGDDGQGHYEGDYHAEKAEQEIRELAALAAGGSDE